MMTSYRKRNGEQSRRKPFNNKAGYIASLRSGKDRGWVVIYEAAEAGMDVDGCRYAVVCETHGTICGTTSMPRARSLMKSAEFCECCMGTCIDQWSQHDCPSCGARTPSV